MALDDVENSINYFRKEVDRETHYIKYIPRHNWMRNDAIKRIRAYNAAIAALEQQKLKGDIMEDSIVPVIRNRLFVCEECHQVLGKRYKFCPVCGRVIKWE